MDIVPLVHDLKRKGDFEGLGEVSGRIMVEIKEGCDFESLPGRDSISWEALLKVSKPWVYIPKLKELGFSKIILPWSLDDDLRVNLEQLSEEDVIVGLAIDEEVSLLELEPFEPLIDLVMIILGEEASGLTQVRELREGNFVGEIMVGGNVSEKNLSEVEESRPDSVVMEYGNF